MSDDPPTSEHSPPPNDRRPADPGSYRDPGSRVFHVDGGVYRALDRRASADWQHLAATRFFPREVAAGRIVATEPAPGMGAEIPGDWADVLRHDRVPVVSYPYEWTFSMLRDAALLQLDLLQAALAEDMILKDATPFNIQWRGARPVFIDIGSFERLEKGDVWVGYRQFLRQFLYPLMLTARVGVPFQPWLRGRPDGLTAEQLRRMMGTRDLLRKGGVLHVALQARAERRYQDRERDVRSELKAAGFSKELIEANVRGLRRIIERLDWTPDEAGWSSYGTGCEHVAVQREAKAAFVAEYAATHPAAVVWDIGANDGHFSKLAAPHAGYVLALDTDEAVLDGLYRSLASDGPANVLPLIQDVSDPSPGIGWRGAERPPLSARSDPDLVLCLAVIHHLVIARNVPLPTVLDWLADLSARVILEFVPPTDAMVVRMTANKRPHEIHRGYDEDSLRHHLAARFVIDREEELPGGGRRLFALSPRR